MLLAGSNVAAGIEMRSPGDDVKGVLAGGGGVLSAPFEPSDKDGWADRADLLLVSGPSSKTDNCVVNPDIPECAAEFLAWVT